MIKVNYTELDGPYGPAMRLEAAGHAGYAPAGQDIVCAGVSTLMQALVSLLAGEENAHSDAFDEPDGPRLTVTAARPCTVWVEGAFELAKAGFALLAERYPDNVCFADRSARGKQEMMDLQLFADASAQLQNTTATSGMSAEMKTYYEKTLLDLAEPALVHDQFGDSYPIPANNGKTIEFRKYTALPKATEPLTEGVTPAGQTLTVTTVTADVHQYGGWVSLTDMLDLAAIDNNVVQATNLLASQGGRTMDTIVRDILNGGTNVIYAPKVADGVETAVSSRAGLDKTAQLTVDVINQAVALLQAQNADPIGDSYVAIVHPYTSYDIRKDPAWVDAHKYAAPEEIFNGEIGKINNVRFVVSSEAKIWTGTGCPTGLAVFSTLVLGAHAYATTELEGGGMQHIVKQLGYGDDPLNQRASVGWKATKTAERLSEPYMVRIESCSERYSAKALAN